jgi:protein-disulfide isomerase
MHLRNISPYGSVPNFDRPLSLGYPYTMTCRTAVKIAYCSLLVPAIGLLLYACQSKSPGTSSEIQALQQQLVIQQQLLERIKSDIDGMKKVMEEGRRRTSQQDEQPRLVSIDDDYIRGQANAKVTLIEFSDFQCPFCERFYRETLPLIDKDYIQTGKVRMVYRDFPLVDVHKDAQKAAEAAQCAGEQGKYWEMHDKIFANYTTMSVDDLKNHARGLDIATDRFDRCVESGKYAEEVNKDVTDGHVLGVQGTPTFFVGLTGQDNTIHAVPIGGARPYAVFKQTFDRFLEGR